MGGREEDWEATLSLGSEDKEEAEGLKGVGAAAVVVLLLLLAEGLGGEVGEESKG